MLRCDPGDGEDEAEWIAPAKYTNFGIVEMHLIGCYTNEGVGGWRRNVSADGTLVTVVDELSAWRQDLRIDSGE